MHPGAAAQCHIRAQTHTMALPHTDCRAGSGRSCAVDSVCHLRPLPPSLPPMPAELTVLPDARLRHTWHMCACAYRPITSSQAALAVHRPYALPPVGYRSNRSALVCMLPVASASPDSAAREQNHLGRGPRGGEKPPTSVAAVTCDSPGPAAATGRGQLRNYSRDSDSASAVSDPVSSRRATRLWRVVGFRRVPAGVSLPAAGCSRSKKV